MFHLSRASNQKVSVLWGQCLLLLSKSLWIASIKKQRRDSMSSFFHPIHRKRWEVHGGQQGHRSRGDHFRGSRGRCWTSGRISSTLSRLSLAGKTFHIGAKKHFSIQKFLRIWCLKNVNCVKNETLKLWILSKMCLWKWEFCQKWCFKTVNLVKNEIFKMWILWKMMLWNC